MDGTALQYALLLLAVIPLRCQSIKVLKIADINTRSNSAAEVLGSDVDKVSCDWWRAGHVTTILTSDWPSCRTGRCAGGSGTPF